MKRKVNIMKKMINLTAEGLAVILGVIGLFVFVISNDWLAMSWGIGLIFISAGISLDREFE